MRVTKHKQTGFGILYYNGNYDDVGRVLEIGFGFFALFITFDLEHYNETPNTWGFRFDANHFALFWGNAYSRNYVLPWVYQYSKSWMANKDTEKGGDATTRLHWTLNDRHDDYSLRRMAESEVYTEERIASVSCDNRYAKVYTPVLLNISFTKTVYRRHWLRWTSLLQKEVITAYSDFKAMDGRKVKVRGRFGLAVHVETERNLYMGEVVALFEKALNKA